MNVLNKILGQNSAASDFMQRQSLYDIPLKSITGEYVDLKAFKGKKILFVNVASKCGFTPQYIGLQNLQDIFKNKLVVIGLPCNQFAEQEPESEAEIKNFCETNYNIKFLMTEKVNVKGENQHPLYRWLTKKELNGVKNSAVKWNFQKYLVDEEGNFIDYFFSTTKPLNARITRYLD